MQKQKLTAVSWRPGKLGRLQKYGKLRVEFQYVAFEVVSRYPGTEVC